MLYVESEACPETKLSRASCSLLCTVLSNIARFIYSLQSKWHLLSTRHALCAKKSKHFFQLVCHTPTANAREGDQANEGITTNEESLFDLGKHNHFTNLSLGLLKPLLTQAIIVHDIGGSSSDATDLSLTKFANLFKLTKIPRCWSK